MRTAKMNLQGNTVLRSKTQDKRTLFVWQAVTFEAPRCLFLRLFSRKGTVTIGYISSLDIINRCVQLVMYMCSSFIMVIGVIIIDNEVEQENYTRRLDKAILFIQDPNPSSKVRPTLHQFVL